MKSHRNCGVYRAGVKPRARRRKRKTSIPDSALLGGTAMLSRAVRRREVVLQCI